MKHTTIRNNKLFCLNCGGEYNLIMPISVDVMTEKIKAFNVLHGNCEKVWTEPKIDQDKSTFEKAMFWNNNGHIGMSSKTMWNCLMNNEYFIISHPYDPDDFSRCYELLETIPEWKNKLYKLKSLSKQWNNLITNWDKLTEMFLENRRTDWKNHKEIGMYELMQKLIE